MCQRFHKKTWYNGATMPEYVYTARNETGTKTTGRLSANSKREALDAIHRLKLLPICVEDSKKGEISLQLFERRVSEVQVADALVQLADLLDNGVPVLHAFQVLEKQTPNPRLKMVIKNIHDRVAEGESIDNAFSAHPKVFNELTISIVRAGAEGAFLEDALRRVGGFIEQRAELNAKMLVAMVYPAILFVFGFTIVSALLIFAVPFFKEMYAQMARLPLPTEILFAIRDFVLRYSLYTVIIAVVLYIWIRRQLSTDWGIRIWDRFKLRLPLVGHIMQEAAVARFCRVFGTLLANGVPILRSLEISRQSTGNTVLADTVRRSAESVSSGETLSKPLAESGIISTQVMAMISVAEESNTLERILVNVAEIIERRIVRQLDMLIRILEPAMLLFMGLLVLFIILALLLPMVSQWSAM